METIVQSLLTGAIDPHFTPEGDPSAIAKDPVGGPRTVHWLGIENDEQGDLNVHGGRDKAIHHYPRDHYMRWRLELGANPLLDRAGAFGENISTLGWKEADVCIGDRLRSAPPWSESRRGASRVGNRATILDRQRSSPPWSRPGGLAGIIA